MESHNPSVNLATEGATGESIQAPARTITRRSEALAEAKRLGLPMPSTAEMRRALQGADLLDTGYLPGAPCPWSLEVFCALTSRSREEIGLKVSYYRQLALAWLQEHATFFPNGWPEGDAAVSRTELETQHRFYSQSHSAGGWQVPKTTPEWVIFAVSPPGYVYVPGRGEQLRLYTDQLSTQMIRALLGTAEPLQIVTTYTGEPKQKLIYRLPDPEEQLYGQGEGSRGSSPAIQLLKVHLDLCHQAASQGGEAPAFVYDLHQAARRLGYRPVAGRGAYDYRTLQRIDRCLKQLADVKLQRAGIGDYSIEFLPYWVSEPLGDRAPGGRQPGLVRYVRIQPGDWWRSVNQRQFIFLPAQLLRLAGDGRGNERYRLALRISLRLALWERVTATKGPQDKTVGALLRDITTLEALMQNRNASRVRSLFHEALQIAREWGGFDVQLGEQAWRTGRGWHTAFWTARLTLTPRPIEGLIRQLPGTDVEDIMQLD